MLHQQVENKCNEFSFTATPNILWFLFYLFFCFCATVCSINEHIWNCTRYYYINNVLASKHAHCPLLVQYYLWTRFELPYTYM